MLHRNLVLLQANLPAASRRAPAPLVVVAAAAAAAADSELRQAAVMMTSSYDVILRIETHGRWQAGQAAGAVRDDGGMDHGAAHKTAGRRVAGTAVAQVRRGLLFAAPSVVVAASGPATRRALGKTGGWIAGVVVSVYVGGHLAVLPARFLLWLLATLLRQPELDDAVLARVDGFIHQLAVFWIPFALLLVLRNVWTAPLDKLFLTALAEVNPAYGATVAAEEPLPLWELVRRGLRRWARTVSLGTAIGVLSLAPVVGWMATPLAVFALTVRAIGPAPALALVAVPLLFPSALSPMAALSNALACQSVMRELVEPFVTRVYKDERARRDFFRAHGVFLTAFAAPFAAAMALPLVGPLVFVAGQAAIAVAIDALHNPRDAT